MKLKSFKRAPFLVSSSIIVFICGIRLFHFDFFEQLEDMTYDMRSRNALHFPAPSATNLAFVTIEDSSIEAVQNGKLGYHFGLYWPRQVYARLVEELAAEKAKAVAFDIFFAGLRPDHPPVSLVNGNFIESDDFFALQMRRAHNVILATTTDTELPALFATNALALGDASTEKDSDGILRRVKAFHVYRHWHPLFKKAAADFGLALTDAKIESSQIVLPQTETTNSINVPVDNETNFNLSDFSPKLSGKARAFTDERVWQMGIVLAAQELKLDLDRAEINLPRHRIILRGERNVERVVPVDADGYFYVNWRMTPSDPRLTVAPIETLLLQDRQRSLAQTNDLRDDFRGKLVVIGSTAQGNDLTDRGATPLQKDTFLVSDYWNVANSVLTNEFVRRAPAPAVVGLIILLGALAAFVAWQLRVALASIAVLLLAAAYTFAVFRLFSKYGYWLPLVFPVLVMLAVHVGLVTYRVVFEEREQRRVKSIFSKIVSPAVVDELLEAPKLSLGGAQREVTVLFTDVRDFTALTDEMQERVTEFVRQHRLDPHAAAAHFDAAAREILDAVNVYLVLVADAVKKHNGTLDKYIGDCVMAFWGAPTKNPRHALACVRAAIDSQRAIHKLNLERAAENQRREQENRSRAIANLPPKPLLPSQQLGTGINTGMTTVGLVGSEQHQYNYTVFGREVNLAARLEGVSGSGRIIISEGTFQHLLRDDQNLAAACISLPEVQVKGIRSAVKIYEVPWKENLKPES